MFRDFDHHRWNTLFEGLKSLHPGMAHAQALSAQPSRRRGFYPSGQVAFSLSEQPTLSSVRQLIESQGLIFEPGFDDAVELYENSQLVGCGMRSGYVLKMLAIESNHQGTDALGELLTKRILSGYSAGQDTLFVFTRPQNVPAFENLNFRLLVTHGTAALLEHGPGLEAYLAGHAAKVFPGRNGAVVINGNPFTLGHLHLVEYAAERTEHFYVFVVREDCSVFPFAVRFRLAIHPHDDAINAPNAVPRSARAGIAASEHSWGKETLISTLVIRR